MISIYVEMSCNLRVMYNYHKFSFRNDICILDTVMTTVVMTPWINSKFTLTILLKSFVFQYIKTFMEKSWFIIKSFNIC